MEIRIENGIAICEVNSNIVAANVKPFVEIIKNTIEDKEDFSELKIDLSKTESIDSMGITFLIALHKNYNAKGKTVTLIGVSEAMLKILKILKLDEVFHIE
jgi:anti-anti-sigma factor